MEHCHQKSPCIPFRVFFHSKTCCPAFNPYKEWKSVLLHLESITKDKKKVRTYFWTGGSSSKELWSSDSWGALNNELSPLFLDLSLFGTSHEGISLAEDWVPLWPFSEEIDLDGVAGAGSDCAVIELWLTIFVPGSDIRDAVSAYKCWYLHNKNKEQRMDSKGFNSSYIFVCFTWWAITKAISFPRGIVLLF